MDRDIDGINSSILMPKKLDMYHRMQSTLEDCTSLDPPWIVKLHSNNLACSRSNFIVLKQKFHCEWELFLRENEPQYKKMSKKKILGRFAAFPLESCRVEEGSVSLRIKSPEKRSYDVKLNENGMVDGADEVGTKSEHNGVSMRVPSLSVDLIRNYKGKKVKIYTIPKNLAVPTGLVLLLEKGHHYSIQRLAEMSKADLDAKLQ